MTGKPRTTVRHMMPFLGLLIFVLQGCSSARITNTWRDPSVTGPIQLKKTVALVIHPDGTVRRVAEDELTRQMGSERAVAAYNILSEDDRKDIEKVKAKLRAAGIDGAVTMKLIDKRTETTYVPGSSYGSFYDYYGGAYYGGSPGYSVTDTIATVETRIYSVNEGKLLWSATSETFNPSSIRENIGDIAKAVGEALRKEKLIASAESK